MLDTQGLKDRAAKTRAARIPPKKTSSTASSQNSEFVASFAPSVENDVLALGSTAIDR